MPDDFLAVDCLFFPYDSNFQINPLGTSSFPGCEPYRLLTARLIFCRV